jgi:hypothetical protein
MRERQQLRKGWSPGAGVHARVSSPPGWGVAFDARVLIAGEMHLSQTTQPYPIAIANHGNGRYLQWSRVAVSTQAMPLPGRGANWQTSFKRVGARATHALNSTSARKAKALENVNDMSVQFARFCMLYSVPPVMKVENRAHAATGWNLWRWGGVEKRSEHAAEGGSHHWPVLAGATESQWHRGCA